MGSTPPDYGKLETLIRQHRRRYLARHYLMAALCAAILGIVGLPIPGAVFGVVVVLHGRLMGGAWS